MRMIDADALKKQIEDFHCKDYDNYNFVRCRACHIDDAISYLDEAPTVGGWISVKDRLPEEETNPLTMDFKEVLCFCDFGGIPRRTDVRTYKFGKRSWMEEGHFWHGGTPMDAVVTHWMPLPEPPEEGKRE